MKIGLNALERTSVPSIHGRVIQALLLITLVWGVLIAAVMWLVIRHEIDELMDQGLRESAEIIYNVFDSMPEQINIVRPKSGRFEREDILIWQVVETNTGALLSRSSKAPNKALQAQLSSELTFTDSQEWRVITIPFQKNPSRFLLVAQSGLERNEARSEAVIYTLLSALLMGAMGAFLISRRLRQELQPLSDLSNAMHRYDPLQPSTTPVAANRSELKPIERAIRELGQRLEQRIFSERAFTAHAAHALRTPLAGIDAQLAIALKESPVYLHQRLIRAREATSRLSRVMQALLAMFRSGIEPQLQVVTLAELLDAIPSNNMEIVVTHDAPFQVDPDLLTAVLMNLLDNAQRHHASRVDMTVSNINDKVSLILHDTGDGCSAENIRRMQSGLDTQNYSRENDLNGLGLILADLVLRAHKGNVVLFESIKGFKIELNWPNSVLKS